MRFIGKTIKLPDETKEEIIDGLHEKGKVHINNFGSFVIHERKLSDAIGGDKGKTNVVTFRPADKFKDRIQDINPEEVKP